MSNVSSLEKNLFDVYWSAVSRHENIEAKDENHLPVALTSPILNDMKKNI